MRKLLIFFIFISSCSSQAPTSNEIELIPEEESSFKAVTTTLQPKDPDSDHDHDHDARDVEKEIHVHGYDIHFMVYPSQDNILKIELTIAGEFEIENHASWL